MKNQDVEVIKFVAEHNGNGCPVRKAADILEGKWTTKIIRELLQGTCRYSELQRNLQGVSPKILTMRLKMLEEHGLISKTVFPTIPPKTEYALTPLGREIEPVIRAMAEFGMRLDNQV